MKRVETWWSCNILIVNFTYNNSYNSSNNITHFVSLLLYNYKLTHDVNNMKYIYIYRVF